MNIFTIIILGTLLVSYALELIADILNLRSLQMHLPEEFRDVFDEDHYRKSQEYTRIRTILGILTNTFNLLVLLAFWFSGGFNWLDLQLRSWFFHPVWTGVLYIGILILANGLINLPFRIYSIFVIEERFGFNKTTPGLFVKDMLKGLGLSIVLGVPLLAVVLAFFQYGGSHAWLYAWLVVVAFSFFIQYIAPTYIMPLFNKFTPLEDESLRQAVLNYAQSVKYPLENIFVMDGSKRSTKSNAFFTGFGKQKRIALFDTLLEQHSIDEMVAIVAHEIGHYKKKHILIGNILSIIHTGILFYLLSIFLTQPGLYEAFYMEHMSVYAGLIFFGMLYSPVELILSIFMQMLSRRNEYAADRFSAETTGKPDAMIRALKKLSAHNLSNLTPHPFYVFLNYSHPPVLKRIQALQNHAGRKQPEPAGQEPKISHQT